MGAVVQSELLGERTVAATVESQVMDVRSPGINKSIQSQFNQKPHTNRLSASQKVRLLAMRTGFGCVIWQYLHLTFILFTHTKLISTSPAVMPTRRGAETYAASWY